MSTRFLYQKSLLSLTRRLPTTSGCLYSLKRPLMTKTPPPTFPMNGTLRYPATGLVDLARRILEQYEAHLKVVENAFTDRDSDERWDVFREIEDIQELYWTIHPQRWKKIEEEYRGEKIPSQELDTSVDFGEPKRDERNLLKIGGSRHADVFQKAIQLWKEQREQPGTGRDTKNEDPLVDFLEFLSLPGHADLFDVE